MRPLPEFIFGESHDGGRQFLIRTTSPRFIAEIFDDESSPEAIIDEVSVALPREQTLANITWLDPHVDLSVDLIRRISDTMAEYDAKLEEE